MHLAKNNLLYNILIRQCLFVGCQSTWTRQLEVKSAKGKMEMTETAETLDKYLSRDQLLGGDLRSVLQLVESTLAKIKAETDNDAMASDRDDQVSCWGFESRSRNTVIIIS